MNRIYLVRHGENRANLTKEFSFRLVDYPLTTKGRLQASQTAAFFRDKQIHAIYSSPLKRASETAQIIGTALDLPVTILEQFREVNVGLLEQQPPTTEAWEEHNQLIGAWFTGHPERRFPGGENYYEQLQGELVRYAYHQHLSGEAAELVSGVPKQGELKSREER